MKKLLTFATILLLLAACDQIQPSADQKERTATEKAANEAVMQVGMPAVTHFTEKRMLKQLYELRDNPNFRTYTYITDLNGGLHKVCDSAGYGMPYATQFSNPQKPLDYMHGVTTIAQPEPNGLFMPAAADGTWIMCLDPKDKSVKPAYFEPRVIVSPFPLIPESQQAPLPSSVGR
jgi:hypothetical protein